MTFPTVGDPAAAATGPAWVLAGDPPGDLVAAPPEALAVARERAPVNEPAAA